MLFIANQHKATIIFFNDIYQSAIRITAQTLFPTDCTSGIELDNPCIHDTMKTVNVMVV